MNQDESTKEKSIDYLLNDSLEKNGKFIFLGDTLRNKSRQCIVICVKKAVDQTMFDKI